MKTSLDHMYEVARICASLGLEEVVISPGSRSAPLSLAFARSEGIRTHAVPHEGSAAFQAMGMALATGKVVGLVCTSGTAGLHYSAAVAEARIQHVPLLVMTADRPPEWINQEDGQTISQSYMYGRLVKESYVCPDLVATTKEIASDQAWHLRRIFSEALICSQAPPAGPVHINIPLRPPLYRGATHSKGRAPSYKSLPYLRQLTPESWALTKSLFEASPKVLLLGGQGALDQNVVRKVISFSDHHQVPVLGDIMSNLHGYSELLRHMDLYLDEEVEALRPDLLVSFGGTLLSRAVKSFFRQYPPSIHLRIALQDESPADTLQCLSYHVPVEPTYFFAEATELLPVHHSSVRLAYRSEWQKQEQGAVARLESGLEQASFGQFRSVKEVLSALPYQSVLHLGNSMPIRYAQYVGLSAKQSAVEVYANRGTCGIDGCLSTALGVCQSVDYVIHTLLIGDISFLHDQGALIGGSLPSGLRIVLFNDHGGGIFRLLPSDQEKECVTHFVMPHHHKVEALASAYDLSYQKARSFEELSRILPSFFQSASTAQLLEIETEAQVDQRVFKEIVSSL